MREPPAALIIAGTVCIRNVTINIDGRKLHMILIVKCVGRITAVAGDAQTVSIFACAHHKFTVHRFPRIIVDVLHDNFQAGAIVGCQMIEQRVADPILTRRCTKTVTIFVPRTIEIDTAVMATLNRRPFADTMRQYRMLLTAWCNHE